MSEYLFLVPNADKTGWVQASVDGKPLKTVDPEAYPGMPKIMASSFIEYKSWEEYVKETVRDFRDTE